MYIHINLSVCVHLLLSIFLPIMCTTVNCNFTFQCVRMETSDSEVGLQQVKVVWRFATIMPGAQCVMTSGELLMPMWPVDSWDFLAIVSL